MEKKTRLICSKVCKRCCFVPSATNKPEVLACVDELPDLSFHIITLSKCFKCSCFFLLNFN